MVSTRRKRQSNSRLLGQLDDFDGDVIIGNATSERQENYMVNEGTNDRDFTVGTSSSNAVIHENVVNIRTLEKCFNERIDRQISNFANTVGDRIQNAILTAIDTIVASEIELGIRSINPSSERDAASVATHLVCRGHVRIHASFKNASENDNVRQVPNVNDETRNNIPDEVSESSVPKIHFDRQTHIHHRKVSLKLMPSIYVPDIISKVCEEN